MNLQRIVWLASYPKSGNTWLRTFIDAYFLQKDEKLDINRLGIHSKSDTAARFFSEAVGGAFHATSIDEWLAARPTALRLLAESDTRLHFVKTHSQARKFRGQPLIPPELTEAAVYIMRNPFDVVPSFARHMSTDIEGAIRGMTDANKTLCDVDHGIWTILGRWDDHVRTWTTAPGLTRRILRYEDMFAEPEPTFRGLLEFLRIPVDFGRLRRTLRRTSFQALQKQEARGGFRERPEKMRRFFAKGKTGAWREDLTPGQVARVREAFLPVLEEWYPELLEETAEVARKA